MEAIKEADIIRCCDGCGAALLHLAPSRADIAPLESAEEVIRLARTGRTVTVLFPGNPYAFSNGSELAEKLDRAGVDFESMPGLILELAAPVMSGIPLTIEGRSASIGFGLVKGAETIVLRLASGWWESGIKTLMADGRTPETPAALILNPGQPGQHRVSAPLVSWRARRRRMACGATPCLCSALVSTWRSASTRSPNGPCTGAAC